MSSPQQRILAIDQGTTNTKAVLVDRRGAVTATASRPVPISFPQPGWVEQNPLDLWESVRSAVNDLPDKNIAAIGISNQRESALLWDRATGEPLGPCVSWQCRRTAAACDALRQRGIEPTIRQRSGLPLDPMFSASKIRWLIEQVPNGVARAKSGEICAGTVDTWLLWELTDGAVHATDAGNASRTQLLSLETCQWDPDLLASFGVPRACLPEVRASGSVFGLNSAGIPVASLVADSHAALFGHAAFEPGSVKATYGTGSSLMSPTGRQLASRHGLATTVAWSFSDRVRYALEGNITNTGGAVHWIASLLGLNGATEVARLGATVPDAGGAYLVPAFAGLGAPHWDSDARGLLCGLTRGITPAHVARAAVESIAFQVYDVFEAMRQDCGRPLPVLFADGGASQNAQLMQFQADILDCPVVRNASADLSAVGAAWMAGLAVGFWKSTEELEALPRQTARFEPQMPASKRECLLEGWKEALNRSRTQA